MIGTPVCPAVEPASVEGSKASKFLQVASSSRVVQKLGISKETILEAASRLTPDRLLHVGSSSGRYLVISDGQHAESDHDNDKERDEF